MLTYASFLAAARACCCSSSSSTAEMPAQQGRSYTDSAESCRKHAQGWQLKHAAAAAASTPASSSNLPQAAPAQAPPPPPPGAGARGGGGGELPVFAQLLEAAGEVAAEQTRMLRMCADRSRQEARKEADTQAACVRDEEAFAEAEVRHGRCCIRARSSLPYAVCRMLTYAALTYADRCGRCCSSAPSSMPFAPLPTRRQRCNMRCASCNTRRASCGGSQATAARQLHA